jgi:hypothetical protein
MVLFLASISAFITWLTLSYSRVGFIEQIGGSALIFLAVGGTLTHYVLSCMRRHCRHDHEKHSEQGEGATR